MASERFIMESSLLLFAIRLAVPLAASQAAEDRQPETVVTQELISSIHTTPQLIFNPFPAYAQKYLPFAMAASMESTSKGQLRTVRGPRRSRWLPLCSQQTLFGQSCPIPLVSE